MNADKTVLQADSAASGGGLIKGLGLIDATTIVIGSMIGSGIFIVPPTSPVKSAAPGLLTLTWITTAVLTIIAALSYGELAAMMPQAGGQYVYLREAFGPLFGFLYGWTLVSGDSDRNHRGGRGRVCQVCWRAFSFHFGDQLCSCRS